MLPFVTIAMPCLNEEGYIEACIRSVLGQDYPADRMEILVADGGSTDQTLAILSRLSAEDHRVAVVPNPERIQAAGMNHILRVARGEVIVRMDVHCEYARDYVRKCVDALERSGADNAGGSQRARAKTFFQKALCAALESPLGVGSARYRKPDQEGFVDTVFLGAFRRRVFETVGLYDPHAVTNEDAELNQRILAAGGAVFLARDVLVHYFPRTSFTTLARQYFRYGTGRARTILKHKQLLALRGAIPFFMVAGGTAMALTPGAQPILWAAATTYGAITLIEAVRHGRKLGWHAIPVVWAVFPVTHVSHGLGFAAGLVRYLLSPDWQEPERLSSAPLPATPPAG